MLKKYKNLILKKIIELGYDVNLFEFQDNVEIKILIHNGFTTSNISQVKLKETPYNFLFLNTGHNETICKFSLNNLRERKNYQGQEDNVFVEIHWSKDFLEIGKTINQDFVEWLKDIGEYILSEQEPDLWELAKHQNNVLGASLQLTDYQANTDEYFTPQEQNLFTLALKEFERKLIEQYQPSPEVIEKIHSQMADIQADLKKSTKKSWFDKFNEMYLPNILVSLALSSEARDTVSFLFEKAFLTVTQILMDTGQILIDYPVLPANL